MIEVFKTNVTNESHAMFVVEQIHRAFCFCKANFDLDDCDKILRVSGINSDADAYEIISFIKNFGCHAVILPDDDQLRDGVASLAENMESR